MVFFLFDLQYFWHKRTKDLFFLVNVVNYIMTFPVCLETVRSLQVRSFLMDRFTI